GRCCGIGPEGSRSNEPILFRRPGSLSGPLRGQLVEKMSDDIQKRVREIQTSMVDSAQSHFDESELGHLRCLIRLAVEFEDYMEHGSVEIATSILDGPYAKY